MAASKTCLQGPPPFPLPRPPHGSLRSLIFFLFYPVFLPFSLTTEPGPRLRRTQVENSGTQGKIY